MRVSRNATVVLTAVALLFPGLVPVAGAGTGSGGGTRQRGTTRLVDGLGSIAAGRSAGDDVALASGLVAVVTAPVPVILSSFVARTDGVGVVLEWALTDDSDPLGFFVYRAAAEEGPYTRVTETILPSGARRWRDDAPLSGGAWYRLSALDRDGTEVHLSEIAAPGAVPGVIRFHPNAPNPARPSTVFRVDLPRAGSVRLTVFDVSGRLRAVVYDGVLDAGAHALPWAGDGDTGPLPSGMYFYRFEALEKVETGKITLVR